VIFKRHKNIKKDGIICITNSILFHDLFIRARLTARLDEQFGQGRAGIPAF